MSIKEPHDGWGPSLNLEAQIVQFEQLTIEYSTIPVTGTVFGVAKVALGLFQVLLGGLVILAMAFPSIASDQARATCCRGFSHLVNGGANMISGALEATWIGAHLLLADRNRYYEIQTRYAGNTRMEIPFQNRLIVTYRCLDGYSAGYYLCEMDPDRLQSIQKNICEPQKCDSPEKLTRDAKWLGQPWIAI